MSIRPLLSTLLAASTLVPSAFAVTETPRLIETRPGTRIWSTKAQREALSRRAHGEGRCGGFRDLTNFRISRNALAPPRMDLAGREPKEQARVIPLLKEANEGNLIAVITKLSAFHDRYYQNQGGVDAATWLKSRFEAIGHGRNDVKVDFFAHPDFRQPSVIAEIAGHGPQKNEVVVIGGHLDSINNQDEKNGAAPGADDNASGIATVLETFRILVESSYAPNRTILFMGYAGEEEGLLGSGEIASWFRNKNRVVIGALQFDMTFYSDHAKSITFITDHTDRDLTRFDERLVDEYVKAPWTEDECGYGCSDHASWTAAGYASSMPFETSFNDHNPAIHSPDDTLKGLDPAHGVRFLKLAIAHAVELAEARAQVWRVIR